MTFFKNVILYIFNFESALQLKKTAIPIMVFRDMIRILQKTGVYQWINSGILLSGRFSASVLLSVTSLALPHLLSGNTSCTFPCLPWGHPLYFTFSSPSGWTSRTISGMQSAIRWGIYRLVFHQQKSASLCLQVHHKIKKPAVSAGFFIITECSSIS